MQGVKNARRGIKKRGKKAIEELSEESAGCRGLSGLSEREESMEATLEVLSSHEIMAQIKKLRDPSKQEKRRFHPVGKSKAECIERSLIKGRLSIIKALMLRL